MLGFVRGKVISKSQETSQCIVLVGDVGYEMTVASRLFDDLKLDSERTFWIHLHVREDAFIMYGFASEDEKYFFKVLLSVSGLGPKHALSLLSEHGAESLVRLIVSKDIYSISKAHGIGKKLAERLILELSGKIEKLSIYQTASKTAEPLRTTAQTTGDQLYEDLSSALNHLGYQPSQIKNVLDMVFSETEKPEFESCLKRALSELSGRSLNKRGAECQTPSGF
jgi:holliday junction DNA helicase RuvA